MELGMLTESRVATFLVAIWHTSAAGRGEEEFSHEGHDDGAANVS